MTKIGSHFGGRCRHRQNAHSLLLQQGKSPSQHHAHNCPRVYIQNHHSRFSPHRSCTNLGHFRSRTVSCTHDEVLITANSHYRKSVGALIVFDVGNRKSFEHVSEWLSAVLDKADPNVQIGLVGHKVDQLRREVSREEGQELASKAHLFYVETTVKDPHSIRNAFKKLLTSTLHTCRCDHNQTQRSHRHQTQRTRAAA